MEEKEKKKVHAGARKETTRPTNRVPTRHLLPIVFTNSLFCSFYLRNCNLPTTVGSLLIAVKKKKQNKKTEEETLFFFQTFLLSFQFLWRECHLKN